MKSRAASLWTGLVAASVGITLIMYGFHRTAVPPFHGLRFTMIGAMIFTLSAAHLVTMWWVDRAKTLHRIYSMGYRHGRRDSSAQLLEDGLWLADRVEGSAARRLPSEDDD